ncbi:hypothetical protein [Streptomyces sp. NPDC048527]|uniref:hypothetical protein n=1 Tax=Streptomyces sp. NPDC048527 TaxID=3365568 RepID=UPI00371BCF7E
MISSSSSALVSTGFGEDEVSLVRIRMGGLTVHASSPDAWIRYAAARPGRDAREIFAPGARISDFSGYYLCGPDNPAYQGQPGGSEKSAPVAVTWDAKQVEFLPSTAANWRPWPWPAEVDPVVLLLHGNSTHLGLGIRGGLEPVDPWAVGAWARDTDRLELKVRPLADPLVVMSCGAAGSRQTMADEVGRLVWAPTSNIALGAEAVDLADRSAGVRARVGLLRTPDDRVGQFRSAYPQGPAGDLVRWAYRDRFGAEELSRMGERTAPFRAAAPAGLRPREIRGPGGLFGWSFYDQRDWASRQTAFNPAGIGPTYVTWTPNHAYRPGTPRDLDPRTGGFLESSEPWNTSGHGALPFDPDDAVFVVGYFARGRFLVTDAEENLVHFEAPRAFGLRLARDHEAAAGTWNANGRTPPRTAVLLTDNEPVPRWAARELAESLPGFEIVTVSRPATLFLDDHLAAGVPQTRVALLPGGGATGTPVWCGRFSASPKGSA